MPPSENSRATPSLHMMNGLTPSSGAAFGRHVRDVRSGPLGAVPVQQRALRVERLAGGVRRGAVVQDAPVGGPREAPAREYAEPGWVGRVAPCGQVACGPEATGVDPVAARRGAVVAQRAKPATCSPPLARTFVLSAGRSRR